ncbi:pyridoxamine 5'-phosphate oxidase family protein [Parahaliea mediterranea]|uniref:pyridoxamine 5'-phosphate oxidase family protein n=1 Tax=Parahaliea mediterranea TaxID=651086 RepID=UPI0013009222|nr:pyridoxamine 5'-phosphate oxidase family protein [Parahaliea mediterranea]
MKLAEIPAYLATIDRSGFPRITPLWFLWKKDSFYMSSVFGKPYIDHLRRNSKASICIEVEDIQSGVHRPNRQLKSTGIAQIYPDQNGDITREISRKYLKGEGSEIEIERRSSIPRLVVKLKPERIWGFGGGKSIER